MARRATTRGRHGEQSLPAVIGARAALLLLLLLPAQAVAQEREGDATADRTLSPYFLVDSDEPDVDRLPLKATSARVTVSGAIADVTVLQDYANEGSRPIEARYVFPASTRAAVYAMRMRVGERTIEALIRERAQARQEYEQARREGRTASLLEQQRPNVFQMNVANIMPGDRIHVELHYVEVLIPSAGIYELVYPTVVGPRYSNVPEAGAPDTERWVANPYRHQGEAPDYAFDIDVTLAAGMPLSRVASPSHRVDVRYTGTSSAHVTLAPGEKGGGNRDFVLRYALAGGAVEAGLLLGLGPDENTFLLTMEPPARVRPAAIVPREYVFVVDVSGSMHGFPLDVSKQLLRDLITSLRPTDTFDVLLFAGSASVLSERSLPATPENVRRAVAFIDAQGGGGGTELVPALRRALALPRTEGVSRTVVLATDGYVAVEKEAFGLVRASLGDANFFAFGIGTAVNRFLIEGLARAGLGEPFVVARGDDAAREAARFRAMIAAPVLTHVRIEAEGVDAFDLEPAAVPDVLAERPVVVVGKWRGPRRGRIVITGEAAGAEMRRVFDLRDAAPAPSGKALALLWARRRVAALGDDQALSQDPERSAEILRLGLRYSLLTDRTSFVAVDSRVRSDGHPEEVVQPLPLPQGVSDLAVGGMASAPLKLSSLRMATLPPRESPEMHRAEGDAMAFREEVQQVISVPPAEPPAVAPVATPRSSATVTSCLGAALEGWNDPTRSRGAATVRLLVGSGGVTIDGITVKGTVAGAQLRAFLTLRLARLGTCLPAGFGRGVVLRLSFEDGRLTLVGAERLR